MNISSSVRRLISALGRTARSGRGFAWSLRNSRKTGLLHRFLSAVCLLTSCLLLVLAVASISTSSERSLSASASSEGLQQTGYYIDYDSDGDFTTAPDGKQKHLVFYKQVSAYSTAFNWGNVENVTGYYVTNYGRRLHYRIIGYRNGAEVFRSGLADYGTPVNIRGASFDYFDVWLVDMDDDGQLVQVEPLVTSKLQFSYEYIAEWPTERPGQEETAPGTDYGLQVPTVQAPTLDVSGATVGVTAPFMDAVSWLFTCLAPFLFPIATAVFLRFLVYGKEGD